MRKEYKRFIIALAAAIILISTASLTFSALEIDAGQTQVKTQAVEIILQDDSESETASLTAETIMIQRPYIVNTGEEDCYVRIRLDISQISGEPMLQVGSISDDAFTTLEFSSAESNSTEYWEKKGEYIYYRNKLTKNKLLAGSSTPEIYSAVRITPDISSQTLELAYEEQNVVIYAQAASAKYMSETEAWELL